MLSYPAPIIEILDRLNKAGFEAYLVGGCIRDKIIGREVDDFDITTNALPDQTEKLFEDKAVIKTGLKHGTLTVVNEGEKAEITTFRRDGEYSDNRHPDKVFFASDLKTDLERRDFTVNTICYDGKNVVDLFGGAEDIKNKVIRCVGEPDKRFGEDALRILRALRFASVLGFEIEEKTGDGILKNKDLLRNISGERIYAELDKLLGGKAASGVLDRYAVVFGAFFKDFVPRPDYSAVARLDAKSGESLAFLLSEVPDVDSCLDRLKASNGVKKFVKDVRGAYYAQTPLNDCEIKKAFGKYGPAAVISSIKIKRLEGENLPGLFERAVRIMNGSDPYRVDMLDIKGDDLIKIGMKGRTIGQTLEKLLELVIEGKLKNEKNELLGYCKNVIT